MVFSKVVQDVLILSFCSAHEAIGKVHGHGNSLTVELASVNYLIAPINELQSIVRSDLVVCSVIFVLAASVEIIYAGACR